MALSDRIWLSEDGKLALSSDKGAQEYIKANTLKISALKVKPLRWREDIGQISAKNYTIVSQTAGKYHSFYRDQQITKTPASLTHAQAIAQKHHENEILNCLDLGAWSEVK